MMGYGGFEGFGMMLGGGLMMLGFWIVPIALVVWAVVSQRGGQRPSAPDETPLEILRRRYARGEISREEYEVQQRLLRAA